MKFDNIYTARKWFRQYRLLNEDVSAFTETNHSWNFGDWILFRHIEKDKISRPILGIFVGYSVWDQALVINFIEQSRAWTHCNSVITNKELNYSFPISHLDPEVESIALWNDDIKVLGWWKTKPTFKQLKNHIQNN